MDVGFEQRPLELALGVEVLVDQRLRDPAARRNLVKRGLVEAPLREDLESSVEDRRPAIGCRESTARGRRCLLRHPTSVLTDRSVS